MRYAILDGRDADLDSGLPTALVPLISKVKSIRGIISEYCMETFPALDGVQDQLCAQASSVAAAPEKWQQATAAAVLVAVVVAGGGNALNAASGRGRNTSPNQLITVSHRILSCRPGGGTRTRFIPAMSSWRRRECSYRERTLRGVTSASGAPLTRRHSGRWVHEGILLVTQCVCWSFIQMVGDMRRNLVLAGWMYSRFLAFASEGNVCEVAGHPSAGL